MDVDEQAKPVPEGSVPVGASCPGCSKDLVAPPDTDGLAWCPNPACEEKQVGFIRRLMLPHRLPKPPPRPEPPAVEEEFVPLEFVAPPPTIEDGSQDSEE